MARYPITPEFLDALPEQLVLLYDGIAEYLLSDICSRFEYHDEATGTAIMHLRQLIQQGYSKDQLEKYLKKMLKLTDAEFTKIWSTATSANQTYFDAVISDDSIFDSDAFDSTIRAIYEQTQGELQNITRTMGFALRTSDGVQVFDVEDTFSRLCDEALLKVESGVSYNVAVRDAVKQLTDSGVQYINYESGWHNRVDVAARRAVLTGVTQMSRRYSDQTAEILGTPYREVSAHRGARDVDTPNPWSNHKAWQGKVYSIYHVDKYPSIYDVCGLDQVDGLCGANCRHIYHAFVDGVTERTYTDEELANIDGAPITYQGREYTAYEATQKQRQIETALRKVKRELTAAKSRGDDEEYITKSVRYRRLNEEYEAFSRTAGLTPQYERGNIAEFGVSAAKETNRAYNALAKKANGLYDTGSESSNIDAYIRDIPIRNQIRNVYSREMNTGRQNGHIAGTNEYNMYVQKQQRQGLYGPSVISVTTDELNELFNQYSSTGIILRDKKTDKWLQSELITANDKTIGQTVNLYTGEQKDTTCFTIHYSHKKGWHIVPAYADRKGEKADV